ncbi:hypothetical protein SAMN05421807_101457 [Virgibacillus chiguensis]|uniref:Uncharacterized protein n=1 Tax=Virgibacillus chiguensis TaxID=411959 RepID=A0A1M5MD59_9BACI|nr:hypothetical protein SAMN05421807_101457 [Virgibacillus chiguensis]
MLQQRRLILSSYGKNYSLSYKPYVFNFSIGRMVTKVIYALTD